MKLKVILFSLAMMLALQSVAQTAPSAPTTPDPKNATPAPQQEQKSPVAAGSQDSKTAAEPVAQDTKNVAAPAGTAINTSATQAVPAIDKDTYVIGAGDDLHISVWKEPDLTKPVPVRPDGKITLPLVGDVQASGQTPHQLEIELAKQLASFVASPSVTVTVQGIHSRRYNIMGEVARPGTYELSGPPSTVLDAIALAGGLRDFAKKKKIYILRVKEDGTQERLPFNYAQVIKGENMSQNVVLQTRDTIVVP